MGCGASKAGDKDLNNQIDQDMENAKLREQLNYKILTLGAGESGKSTMIKQLVFIHKPPMSESEQKSFVSVLHSNLAQTLDVFVKEVEQLGLHEQWTAEEKEAVEATKNIQGNITPEQGKQITIIWKSKPIVDTFRKKNEFWHLDTSQYYFDNAERFADPDFIPTDADIVAARKRTTGVVVTAFEYEKVNWSVVDVGGQRSERRKWINCFSDVKAIMFVVNLAGYAKVLFEDKTVNRMHESMDLFESTLKNQQFAETPVFLFLNKKDLFEEMLKEDPLTKAFPEYTGSTDVNECMQYVADQYQKRLPAGHSKAEVTFVQASLREEVQKAFNVVSANLIKGQEEEIAKLHAQANGGSAGKYEVKS